MPLRNRTLSHCPVPSYFRALGGLPLSCCEQGWLLKNSFSRNLQKSLRVRMPYKRFSLVGYTFQVTHFDRTFTGEGLFQQPQGLSLTENVHCPRAKA